MAWHFVAGNPLEAINRCLWEQKQTHGVGVQKALDFSRFKEYAIKIFTQNLAPFVFSSPLIQG